MEDFAYSAMLRLIRAGLAAQGIPPPDVPPTAAAHVPLELKRRLLAQLAAAHGPPVLLRIPDALPNLPPEPALRALTLARDPLDLLQRWARLERCAHSRHRIRWEQRTPGDVELTHYAIGGGEGPRAEEDLLVFALLTKLCEMIGTRGLAAGPVGAGWPWRRDGAWCENAGPWPVGAAWRWRFEHAARACPPVAVEPPPPPVELLRRTRAMVAADPARGWTIDVVAAALAVSPRSLQRRLRLAGSTLTQVLAEVRMEAAAELLGTTRVGLAEIGFLCGFADQAHFTRAFKRFSAFTPAAYRQDFART